MFDLGPGSLRQNEAMTKWPEGLCSGDGGGGSDRDGEEREPIEVLGEILECI